MDNNEANGLGNIESNKLQNKRFIFVLCFSKLIVHLVTYLVVASNPSLPWKLKKKDSNYKNDWHQSIEREEEQEKQMKCSSFWLGKKKKKKKRKQNQVAWNSTTKMQSPRKYNYSYKHYAGEFLFQLVNVLVFLACSACLAAAFVFRASDARASQFFLATRVKTSALLLRNLNLFCYV